MRTVRNTLVLLSILVITALTIETAAVLNIPGFSSLISKAEARIGRPATPVSVAGAGRRTVRRCAAGVYNC